MDVKAWVTQHKWAAGGAAAGVAVGAYVLYRRHQAGSGTPGGGGASGSTSAGGGYIANPAAADTTGTDVANWLGTQTQQIQGILSQYLAQQQAQANTGGATSGPYASPYQSNDQWAQAAYHWLATQTQWSGVTPTVAGVAIQDYLAGNRLNSWEENVINPIVGGTKQWGPGIGPPPVLPAAHL